MGYCWPKASRCHTVVDLADMQLSRLLRTLFGPCPWRTASSQPPVLQTLLELSMAGFTRNRLHDELAADCAVILASVYLQCHIGRSALHCDPGMHLKEMPGPFSSITSGSGIGSSSDTC